MIEFYYNNLLSNLSTYYFRSQYFVKPLLENNKFLTLNKKMNKINRTYVQMTDAATSTGRDDIYEDEMSEFK